MEQSVWSRVAPLILLDVTPLPSALGCGSGEGGRVSPNFSCREWQRGWGGGARADSGRWRTQTVRKLDRWEPQALWDWGGVSPSVAFGSCVYRGSLGLLLCVSGPVINDLQALLFRPRPAPQESAEPLLIELMDAHTHTHRRTHRIPGVTCEVKAPFFFPLLFFHPGRV